MITEDYVSFEVAKLLKEKGFDEGCSFVVNAISKGVMPVSWPTTNSDIEDDKANLIALPTHQMAMKWLREVHNKHCDIGYDIDLYWFFQIIELKELKEHFDYSELKYYHTENDTGFNSYEEAVEAALKYTLEKLI